MTRHSYNQRTLQKAVSCEGVGLHSGEKVKIRLTPAPADSGVIFVRVDLPGRPEVPARVSEVVDTAFATTLGRGEGRVGTVEHLLAALYGMGIDNARIEVSGPEVPILDGSAAPWLDALKSAGVREQDAAKRFLVMRKSVTAQDGDKFARLAPSKNFKVDCTIDFRHPLISDQSYSLEFSDQTFARDIAQARTFGFLRDVEKLKRAGLARGGSLDNAIVVDDFSIVNPGGLRFPDEFVRHKLLDALGDMSLLGFPVVGHLSVFKSGHALNRRLMAKVLADPTAYEVVRARRRDAARLDLEFGELAGVLAPTAA